MKPFKEILANAKAVAANRVEVKSVGTTAAFVRVEFSDGTMELFSPDEATVENIEKCLEKKLEAVRKAVAAAEALRHELGLFDEEESFALEEQGRESMAGFVNAEPGEHPF